MGYRNVAGLLAILGLVLLSSFKIASHQRAEKQESLNQFLLQSKINFAQHQRALIHYDTPAGFDADLVYPALVASAPVVLASPQAAVASLEKQTTLLDGTVKFAFFSLASGYNATLADGGKREYAYKGNVYGVLPLTNLALLQSLLECHVQELVTLEDAVLVKVSVNQPDSPAVLAFGQSATLGTGWSGWLVQARTDVAAPLLAGAGAQDLGQSWWLLPAQLTSDQIFNTLRPASN